MTTLSSANPPYPIPRRRPTSLAEYHERNRLFSTEEQQAYVITFQPRPTDVIITPYGKSGTTWLQQMIHGLRTRGDMDFDDISGVVPWIEEAHILGQELDAPQKGPFRAYKSHRTWETCRQGGRYIVSIRNPKDVLVSMFRFMEGWFWEIGAVSIEEYAADYLTRSVDDRGNRAGHWEHIKSWWAQRHRDDVLLLCYEHMRQDLLGTVHRVAEFVNIDLDDQLLDVVMHQSSFEFMLAHKDKFDDRLIREHTERALGLPLGSDSAKVREGKVGSHSVELPPSIAEQMDEIWHEEIGIPLALGDYESFCRLIAEAY